MAAAQRPQGWGDQAFAVPVLPALQGPYVKSPEQMGVRDEVEMGPVMLAAVAQEETGMGVTAPWGSQTPGRVVPPSLVAGFSSGTANVIHSVTLKSVCLTALTVRLLQPARLPMTSTVVTTSTMGTVRKAATLPNVAGMGVTVGPEMEMEIQSRRPPWLCW